MTRLAFNIGSWGLVRRCMKQADRARCFVRMLPQVGRQADRQRKQWALFIQTEKLFALFSVDSCKMGAKRSEEVKFVG